MANTIRLGRIVAAFGLDPRTSRYALDRLSGPLKLPAGDGSGVHRDFEPWPAIRLALGVILINSGLNAKQAVPAVAWLEARYRRLFAGPKSVPFDNGDEQDLVLHVINSRYVNFSLSGCDDPDVFFEKSTQRTVTRQIRDTDVILTWNLSEAGKAVTDAQEKE